jgi:hypothetical protein
VNPDADPEATEADLLDQQRELHDDQDDVEPPNTVDAEADPADVTEQNLAVPPDEEDWSDE